MSYQYRRQPPSFQVQSVLLPNVGIEHPYCSLVFNQTTVCMVGFVKGSQKTIGLNPYKPSVFFCGTDTSADPAQTPQNAASDQGLHCLLTE